MQKSTIDEIRLRFDKEVDRFSNLHTGQVSTMDAGVSLELLTGVAKVLRPEAMHLLDIGCGAGNYTLRMLMEIPDLNCTLVDLSRPMLDKAYERVNKVTSGKITLLQADIREIELPEDHFDIILAGAVLHHLREEKDWQFVFRKLYSCLSPGGCLLISDLVLQENEKVNQWMWSRYANYLQKTGGKAYQENVFQYIEKEDSPRSLNFQLDLMKKAGFRQTEILHKNTCFAAYGGIK